MPTDDQTRSARLHGEALLAAQEPMFQSVIDRLAAEAEGRDDLRVETAGLIAGWWFGSPDIEQGYELIAVGLLLLAGPVDGDLLVQWVRTGTERRGRSRESYDPSRGPTPASLRARARSRVTLIMTDSGSILDQATLATLDRWLAYRVWHTRTPGAQVAIGHRGKLLFSRAYGYADLEGRQPMRTDHLFRVASHSKTFTATLVLQLVERGRLALDDRLRDHLPEVADGEIGETRIRELLEHTAGALRDGVDGDFWQGTRPFPDRTELVAMVSTVKRPPGELFAYSNLGYGLLGAVVESITGDPFGDVVRRHIIEPLDLTNTAGTYRPDRAGDYAVGYSSLATGLQRHRIDPVDTRALDAAAGVTSTAEDLVAYFSAHAMGDTRLITDRSKRLMQRTANITDPRRPDGPGYGLGMATETFDEHRTVGHGGGFPGHITRTLVDADDGLVVTALTNAIDGPASQLASGVLKLVDDARSHPPEGPGFGPEVLAHTGRWRNLWSVVDIGVLGGRLLAIDPTRWEPVEDVDELEVVEPSRFRITAGGGYGAVGEPVVFAEDRTLRYGPMSFTPLDELPERPDALA